MEEEAARGRRRSAVAPHCGSPHTSQGPATAVLPLSCACGGTHNSHLRRRIVAAVNAAAVAAAESPTPSRTAAPVPAKRGTTTRGDCLVRTISDTGKEGDGEVQPNLTSARRRGSSRVACPAESSTMAYQNSLAPGHRRESEVSRSIWFSNTLACPTQQHTNMGPARALGRCEAPPCVLARVVSRGVLSARVRSPRTFQPAGSHGIGAMCAHTPQPSVL